MARRISAILVALIAGLLLPLAAAASGTRTFSSDDGYQVTLPEGWRRFDTYTLRALVDQYGEETAALKGFSQDKLDIYARARSTLYFSDDCATTLKITCLAVNGITMEMIPSFDKTITAILEKTGAQDVTVTGDVSVGGRSFYRVDYDKGDSPLLTTYLLYVDATLYCITFAGATDEQAEAVLTTFTLFDTHPAQN